MSDGFARYAVKRWKQKFRDDRQRHRGMFDLAIEAEYLSSLSHSNIVKMRGMLFCESMVETKGFYIVLDRLHDTLQIKVDNIWPREYKHLLSPFARIGWDKEKKQKLYLERMIVAYDLATAFRYLHKKRIIYRDLKPENIGFDVRGDVKVFDFGLCKEIPLPSTSNPSDKLFKLTPQTGSIPYMAPEVMLREKYNSKVDAFSFRILLWEVFVLKIPMKGFDRRDFKLKVCNGQYRLDCNIKIPELTNVIMKECWSHDKNDRP